MEKFMQIDIQSRGFSLTEALLKYSKQRLLFSMSYFSDYINRVVVRLSDINGPRGGTDKRCHIQLMISGLPDIVIEDTEVDLYAAIDRAMGRAKRTVARRLDRQQTLLKQNQVFLFKSEQDSVQGN
jgi:ribosomal subunit interface protein